MGGCGHWRCRRATPSNCGVAHWLASLEFYLGHYGPHIWGAMHERNAVTSIHYVLFYHGLDREGR